MSNVLIFSKDLIKISTCFCQGVDPIAKDFFETTAFYTTRGKGAFKKAATAQR
jgi:hypothetical protein